MSYDEVYSENHYNIFTQRKEDALLLSANEIFLSQARLQCKRVELFDGFMVASRRE